MQKEDRFLKITDFLTEFKFFHEKEMMEHYPNGFGEYEPWVEDLMKLNFDELRRLDFYLEETSLTNKSLIDFLRRAKKLLELEESFGEEKKLSQNLRRKLTRKKEYEISQILELTKNLSFKTLIDVGGGIGHLAMAIANQKEANVFCFDMDENLQHVGKEKIKTWLPEIKERLLFVPKKFDDKTTIDEFFKNETLLTGLHACGSLSTNLIKLVVQNKIETLINFGCCYHKLNDEYNLSSLSLKNPLTFSKHALTIAAKSNTPMTEFDLKEKYRVKRFRYALHFFLTDKTSHHLLNIGNTRSSDFENDFATFAKKFATAELKDFDSNELNSFFASKDTQNMIEKTIRAGLLRTILGRLIEMYLVLDRAIYLEENAYNTQVLAYFTPHLSPRNILIFAQKG